MGWTIWDSLSTGTRGFLLFSYTIRLALGPTLDPINGHPWLILLGQDQGMWLTTHVHVVPRLKIRGPTPPLPLYAFTV